MEDLPRRDSRVQDLLQPFVKKVKEKQKTESKRKALDPQTEEETATADEKIKLDSKTKKQRETGGSVPVRGESTVGDQPTVSASGGSPSVIC
ncbi:unnamed protein product [Tetraodon nigroviridis]|uniref:(spotted green pufferfish) hypothetical protein n=1 Tax=Tetraodon nigroviridis TaxID=99883 RepID=Q4SPS1_TETNG|nr:unnamed protein product [Tetraodon nigroviridis]